MSGYEIWLASDNAKKRDELARMLAPLGVRLRTLAEAPAAVTIIEDQPDFAGNARNKAVALARVAGAPALGDDSGLCVAALGGAPGVFSARWAGEEASDAERIAKLLGALADAGTADRRAAFVCSLCLAGADGRVITAIEEHCQGRIIDSPRGAGGFGYDPVFVADELAAAGDRRTFAELTAAEKDRVSHRGRALRRLAAFLDDWSPPPTATMPPQ